MKHITQPSNKQLIMINVKPILIEVRSAKGVIVERFLSFCKFQKPKPSPIRRLNDGPAKQPVHTGMDTNDTWGMVTGYTIQTNTLDSP